MEVRSLELPLRAFGAETTAVLVLGMIFSLVKLSQHEIFRTVRGRCPFCATEQQFTVMGRFKLPKRLYCKSCQQELTLEGPTTAPRHSPT